MLLLMAASGENGNYPFVTGTIRVHNQNNWQPEAQAIWILTTVEDLRRRWHQCRIDHDNGMVMNKLSQLKIIGNHTLCDL